MRNIGHILNVVKYGNDGFPRGEAEMGITERREREREEVRRKILDAARELFATEGYAAVTMRKIAEAIEYSPTAIYGHFEDKDDLVHALCHEDFARLLAVFDGQTATADPSSASACSGADTRCSRSRTRTTTGSCS